MKTTISLCLLVLPLISCSATTRPFEDEWDSEIRQPGVFTGKNGVLPVKIEEGKLKVGDNE